MKYMLLIHSDGSSLESLGPEEQKQLLQEYMALADTPGIAEGHRLQPPDTATTVRVENGRTLTTDGPFVEAKEALGGFFIYEADDLDAAIQLAAQIPAARSGGAVEVRPIMER
jgi:hypothetical protein